MPHAFAAGYRVRNFVWEVSCDRTIGHVYDHFCPFDIRKLLIEGFHAAYIDRRRVAYRDLQYLHVGDVFHCVASGCFRHHPCDLEVIQTRKYSTKEIHVFCHPSPDGFCFGQKIDTNRFLL